MDVLWVAFVVLTTGIVILALLFYRLSLFGGEVNPTGVWFNENLNIRMLLHDIDSVFQGSVVWANGTDKMLGMRIVENLRFDKSKTGKGQYSDPITGNQYEIKLNLKRKDTLLLQAYYPNTGNLAFSQEWRQVEN